MDLVLRPKEREERTFDTEKYHTRMAWPSGNHVFHSIQALSGQRSFLLRCFFYSSLEATAIRPKRTLHLTIVNLAVFVASFLDVFVAVLVHQLVISKNVCVRTWFLTPFLSSCAHRYDRSYLYVSDVQFHL